MSHDIINSLQWPTPPANKNSNITTSSDPLLPVIVQNNSTGVVLMLGYMNKEAFEATKENRNVTFYSRSKKRLWMKGESSGHTLKLIKWSWDCDSDTLLIFADPQGPTCHLLNESCFGDNRFEMNFLSQLESIIQNRMDQPDPKSYTTQLMNKGLKKISQKVGEEGVEVALASVMEDKEEIIEESADLLYHLLVTLKAHSIDFSTVVNKLNARNLV